MKKCATGPIHIIAYIAATYINNQTQTNPKRTQIPFPDTCKNSYNFPATT